MKVDERSETARSDTLAYGRLAIAVLALATIVSAGALTIALAVVAATPRRLAGLPYRDMPAAVIAVGAAASLATLSAATAYLARVCVDRGFARSGAALRTATYGLMTAAYLAFGAGGLVVTRFCLEATRVLARFDAPG